ncbi:TPA_asm: protein 3 [Primula virus 1]|uniref:Protein 3 n=1 Tax=Primula virus 1 TaxID=2977982 RepID=A0A9N6YJH5_9RHAB|nr:TPA_asm: protein 3 [Primula virus 1]
MSLKKIENAATMSVTEIPEQLDVKIADVGTISYMDEVMKKSFESNKRVTVKHSMSTFRFDELTGYSKFKNEIAGNKSLCNPEIHIVWKPFLPNQNRDWKLNITLLWDGDDEPLQSVVIPMHLHAHIIMYPNHSAPISKKTKLPWHIDFKTEDADISDEMVIADVWAQLKGDIGRTSTYGGAKTAKIISLVPVGEHFSGVAISKPYHIKDPLIITGYQIKMGGNQDKAKLLMLQEYGVDIHGLSMCSQLKSILASITKADLKNRGETATRDAVMLRICGQIGAGNMIKN